jgi:exodeoxyribonuclease VII large subunit
MNENILPVGALIMRINDLLSYSLGLNNVWISGEVSGLTKHYTGHYYFTLKDRQGQIACAMWKSYASKLNFDLKEGMKVLAAGNVSVYEKSGKIQLNVRALRPEGVGALYLEFEQRKNYLQQAGYFAAEHKLAKPAYMEDIAIVTGKEAAALQDVLSTLKRRWPMSKVTLYPALVQGPSAPASIISALKRADQNKHDVILLVRGGGSFEDLFCFNDVDLIKTIYDLKTYTVTGIGHEIDYTLSDYASDQRCVTPTAAAQFVSWDQNEIYKYLTEENQFLYGRMQQLLDQGWQRLSFVQNYPYFKNPLSYIETKKQQLAYLNAQLEHFETALFTMQKEISAKEEKMVHAMQARIYENKMQLQSASQILAQTSMESKIAVSQTQLENNRAQLIQNMRNLLKNERNRYHLWAELLKNANPDAILAKGYARITSNEKIISRTDQVELGQYIEIVLQNGRLGGTVDMKETNDV